jgi:hypothetical protein
MPRLKAVKTYFEQAFAGTSHPVTSGEFMTFWKSLSEADRDELGGQAANALGVTLSES